MPDTYTDSDISGPPEVQPVANNEKNFLYVALPFTMEFDISRNTLSSMNEATIRVYNLSEKNRSLIRKNSVDFYDKRTVTLRAGYGKNPPVVFTGNITKAFSVREGTNFITQIEAFDGGFAFVNGNTNRQFPAVVTQKYVVEQMISDLPGVTLGVVGESYTNTLGSRGNSYSGNTKDILTEVTNGQFFVDNNVANVLSNSEYLQGHLPLIDSESGLLGTPRRELTQIAFEMIFEPQVITGQGIELRSSTDKNFNGLYKVVAIKHRGMISETVCGDAITALTLDNNNGFLSLVGAT